MRMNKKLIRHHAVDSDAIWRNLEAFAAVRCCPAKWGRPPHPFPERKNARGLVGPGRMVQIAVWIPFPDQKQPATSLSKYICLSVPYVPCSAYDSVVSGSALRYRLRTSSGSSFSRGLLGVTTTCVSSLYCQRFFPMKIRLAGFALPFIM